MLLRAVPLMHDALLELARICCETGEPDQASSILMLLLEQASGTRELQARARQMLLQMEVSPADLVRSGNRQQPGSLEELAAALLGRERAAAFL